MYNTVIFDLDGTLLNTIDDLADAINYMQNQFGWEVHTVDTVRQNVGNGIRNLFQRLHKCSNRRKRRRRN